MDKFAGFTSIELNVLEDALEKELTRSYTVPDSFAAVNRQMIQNLFDDVVLELKLRGYE